MFLEIADLIICVLVKCTNNNMLLYILCSTYNASMLFCTLVSVEIFINLAKQTTILGIIQTKGNYLTIMIDKTIMMIKLAGPMTYHFGCL